MPYRITDWTRLDAEPHRIALEQLDRAIAAVAGDGGADGAGTGELGTAARAYAARKRCKKVRALLRLVRPALERERHRELDERLRAAARRVSALRDAAARPYTYDRICARFGGEIDRRRVGGIRAALTRRARAEATAFAADEGLAPFATDLAEARERVDAALADARIDRDVILEGFARARARAQERFREALASGTLDAYHGWRKGLKYHRLHLRLLGPLWPVPLAALEAEARRLGDLLGGARDIALLDEHLAGRLQAELEDAALPLGQRLFAERDATLVGRLAAWHAIETAGTREAADAQKRSGTRGDGPDASDAEPTATDGSG